MPFIFCCRKYNLDSLKNASCLCHANTNLLPCCDFVVAVLLLCALLAQCMRLYCPDRLLFDQLEWQKERAKARAAKELANSDK